MTVLTKFAVTLASLCLWGFAPAGAQEAGRWLRAESQHFIVYADRNEREVRAAVQSLEDLDHTLRVLTGVGDRPAPNKLEIFLLRSSIQFNRVVPRSDALGVYLSTAEGTAVILTYRDSSNDMFAVTREQVLSHEYAHHFMLNYFSIAYPRWYVEGWAEYVSTITVEDRVARIGGRNDARGMSIIAAGLLPINRLLAPERVRSRDPDFTERFYATSWVAASYITNTPERQDGLRSYVRALNDGADPIDAFEPAFGLSPRVFFDELVDHVNGRTQIVGFPLGEANADIAITRLPRVYDDLLLEVARMRLLPRTADDDLISDANEAAAGFPNDPYAERARARAALLAGDRARGRAILEGLVAAAPEDVESRFLLGRTYLSEAEATPDQGEALIAEARRHFVQGFRANPDHYPTLYAYAATFAGAATPMTEDQLNVMMRALELAPQQGAIRLTLAEELIEASFYDNALMVLRPLMYAPHGGAGSERARVLADAARSRRPPPPPETPAAEEEED
jgi:hypothetical protein